MPGSRIHFLTDGQSRLIESLRASGFQVEKIPSVQALLVANHLTPPDCILVQWSLVNGPLTGLRDIIAGKPAVPSIVQLDERHLEQRDQVRRLGFSAIVMAPYSASELINQIRRLTGGAARTGTRLSAAIPVGLTAGQQRVRGVTSDVSPRGLGVLVDRTLPLETEVEIALVGRAQTLRLSGTIVSHRAAGERWHMGIQLRPLSDEERTRLRDAAQAHTFTPSQVRIVSAGGKEAVFTDEATSLVKLPELI